MTRKGDITSISEPALSHFQPRIKRRIIINSNYIKFPTIKHSLNLLT